MEDLVYILTRNGPINEPALTSASYLLLPLPNHLFKRCCWMIIAWAHLVEMSITLPSYFRSAKAFEQQKLGRSSLCNIHNPSFFSFISSTGTPLSILLSIYLSFYVSTSLVVNGRLFSFLILYTASRTSWTGGQPVIRSLPTQRRTQT
jgi:hypothetical protein